MSSLVFMMEMEAAENKHGSVVQPPVRRSAEIISRLPVCLPVCLSEEVGCVWGLGGQEGAGFPFIVVGVEGGFVGCG